MTTHYFCIAEHLIKIVFQESPYNSMRLLASFLPFNVNDDDNDKTPLFTITIDDTTMPVDKTLRERIRDFDTGNGDTIVDRITTGGYQFIVKDLNAKPCALLVANEDFSDVHCALNGNFDMRRFGLNNVMMLTYAFAGSLHDTLLIHASLVRHDGYGYAFIAKSGTGKSTQVSMWLRYIDNCDLMNDDTYRPRSSQLHRTTAPGRGFHLGTAVMLVDEMGQTFIQVFGRHHNSYNRDYTYIYTTLST